MSHMVRVSHHVTYPWVERGWIYVTGDGAAQYGLRCGPCGVCWPRHKTDDEFKWCAFQEDYGALLPVVLIMRSSLIGWNL